MPAPSPVSGSQPQAPRCPRLTSASSPRPTIAFDRSPAMLATKATPRHGGRGFRGRRTRGSAREELGHGEGAGPRAAPARDQHPAVEEQGGGVEGAGPAHAPRRGPGAGSGAVALRGAARPVAVEVASPGDEDA